MAGATNDTNRLVDEEEEEIDLELQPVVSFINIDNYNATQMHSPTTTTVYRTYKSRWYVLFLYSCLQLTLGISSYTWPTMARSAQFAFGWGDGHVTMLASWAPVMCFLGTYPFCWMMSTKGLRFSCLVSCACLTVGAGISCITAEPPYVTWLAQIGQALIALSSPFLFASATLFSATWFSPKQRVTSTAISQLFLNTGFALPSMFIPWVVEDPSSMNMTALTMANGNNLSTSNSSLVDTASTSFRIRKEIMHLLYAQFGMAAFFSLLTLIYFPAKPPTPPREPSAEESLDVKVEFLKLLRMKNFWFVCFAYALTTGVYWGWLSLNVIIFSGVGYTQTELNSVSMWGSVAYIISLFIVAALLDKVYRYMKPAIMVLYGISFVLSLWITLGLLNLFSRSLIFNIGIPLISLTIVMTTSVTLIFELACEVAHPVGEGVTNGMLIWIVNPFQTFLLLLQMAPNIGTLWMCWTLVGSYLVGIVIMAFCKVQYNRSNAENKPIEKER